jgi:hypothetical protein
MKIFPLTIYVLLKPFIQILPSDSKKSLWDSRTTATLSTTAAGSAVPTQTLCVADFDYDPLKRSFSEIPTIFLTPYREFDPCPHTPHTRQLIFKFSV